MSKENVELVTTLASGPDVDLGSLLRDDAAWAATVERSLLDPGFEAVGTVIGTERPYVGPDGLREFLLDWLAPWDTYRSELERTIDLGERVVALYRAFGRREGSAHEIESRNAWIWTFRDGKVAGITGYADPAEALEAVGLAE
jgi:ketosteroid isomerase-like protein